MRSLQRIVRNFLKEKMKTIPDLIDDIKRGWKKTKDPWFAFLEHWSSKINSDAWAKRWRNRKQGTGSPEDDQQ